MVHFIYRCPRTRMNVQAWRQDDCPPESNDEYEAFECPACTRLHFIDRATGKLLGDRGDESVRIDRQIEARWKG